MGTETEPKRVPNIQSGDWVGHYELVDELAHGGMGIVYRARDAKLGRDVALKCPWPEILTNDAQRARFLREARATANLSHPHIVPLFDAFEQDGVPWLALQLVEGKDLSDLIAEKGPLSIVKVLRYGEELASALDFAHSHQILHRDLTPANVIVSRDDWVFLTDFGLVRRIWNPEGGGSSDPTLSRTPLTDEARTVGTPRYMSPEQALGRELDRRSDIFSLGLLVYEMAAGKPAFPGNTLGELIDNVLHYDPPPLTRIRADAPSGLDDIVSKACAKRPEDRYESAAAMESALRELRLTLQSKEFAAARKVSRVSYFGVLALTAALALVGTGWLWERLNRGRAVVSPSAVTHQLTTASGWEGEPAISPDGHLVAYVSDERGNEDIWLVDIDGRSSIAVTSSPSSDREPAWFPDGRSLAFVSDRTGEDGIWKISMLGGSATLLVPDATSPAISPDGTRIAFARAGPAGTTRIAVAPLDDPNQATFLTSDDDGLWDHREPSWSPDGTMIAYASQTRLWVVPAAAGPARPLTPADDEDFEPAWSSDGSHVYFTSGRQGTTALWRISSVGGGPLERVTSGTGGESSPSVSADGSRLAYSTSVEDNYLLMLDRDSGEHRLFDEESLLSQPTLAPDESSVVFVSDREGGKLELWRLNLEEGMPIGSPRRLTNQPGNASHPSYSPDGRWIAYYRNIDNQRDIWIVPSEGGTPIQFTDHEAPDIQPAWSPDGSLLAFASERGPGGSQIWVAPIAFGRRTAPPRLITRGDAAALAPVFSPDGTEVAYITQEPGDYGVWIVSLDQGARPRRVASGALIGRARWDAATDTLLLSGKWKGSELGLREVSPGGGLLREPEPNIRLGYDPSWVFDLSRDGRFVCFTRTERRGNIWFLSSSARSY